MAPVCGVISMKIDESLIAKGFHTEILLTESTYHYSSSSTQNLHQSYGSWPSKYLVIDLLY